METKTKAIVVVVARFATLLLEMLAIIMVTSTPDVGISAFQFIRIFVPVQLLVSSGRFVHDCALTFYGGKAPRDWVTVTFFWMDLVFQQITFAAAAAAFAVLDFISRNVKQCGQMEPHACSWWTAAGVLTFFAWLAALPVAYFNLEPAKFASGE